MKWYLVKLVFRIICGNGDHAPQFDEQLRLIQAKNPEEAHLKARELGEKGEELFFNLRLQPVKWQFIDAPELYSLEKLIHGAELYSRIEEKEHAETYIGIVQKKAEELRSGSMNELLKPA